MRPEDRDDPMLGGGGSERAAVSASSDAETCPVEGDEPDWSPAERALLDCALDFFGAAEAVIDYAGPDRPHLRYDVDGLQEVRSAMALLEERVHVAHEAGVTPERIASITRLEQEIVELIIARHGGEEPHAAAPPDVPAPD